MISLNDLINDYQRLDDTIDGPDGDQAKVLADTGEAAEQFAGMSADNMASQVQAIKDAAEEKFTQALAIWHEACKDAIASLEQVKSSS